MKPQMRPASWAAGAVAGVGVGVYAALVCSGWLKYGHASPGTADERDALLDRFIPSYDIVERHHIGVAAPAPVTLAAAQEQNLLRVPLVRLIFKARELALGASADARHLPEGLRAQMESMGWGLLAEVPGREVVFGAVTKPWEADVEFRALPPEEFAAFNEPGFVKIAWTLRADPAGEHSIFRTETRAVATDAVARARFRRYWACVSPGVSGIRWLSLRPLKRDAEQRAAASATFSTVQS